MVVLTEEKIEELRAHHALHTDKTPHCLICDLLDTIDARDALIKVLEIQAEEVDMKVKELIK